MTFDPCRQYRNDISLFFGRQFSPGWDAVPLGQTSPAAAGRGVLGDKDRMPAHRGLPPVIGNNGRSEAHAHEICGMTPDSLLFARYRRYLPLSDEIFGGTRMSPAGRTTHRRILPHGYFQSFFSAD